MAKVFLGGTCNESVWRNYVINHLQIDYFNPIVDDWTPECQDEEIKQRKECDYCLYVITPRMIGTYSIAEAVDDSNKRPEKTIFCYVPVDVLLKFNKSQEKSLDKVGEMIENNGGKWFTTLDDVIDYLNSKK